MRRRKWRTRTLLAGLCAIALLASCGQAGDPAPSPPARGPSDAARTPSAAVPAAPPMRPQAATGGSLAAGKAFIGHYVDLLNYSHGTGDPGPLMAASDKGCIGCKSVADYAKKVNLKNGTLEGDYKDRLIEVKEIFRGSSGRLGGSAILKSGTYVERDSPTASAVPQGSATGTMEFTLSPRGGNWVMYEMEIKS